MSQLAVAVSPFAQTERSVGYRANRLTRVQVMGVTEDYLITNSTRIDVGRFISEDDVERNRQVAVIGAGIAEKLFDQRHGPARPAHRRRRAEVPRDRRQRQDGPLLRAEHGRFRARSRSAPSPSASASAPT